MQHKPVGSVSSAIQNLVNKLQSVTLQDLQFAKALADAHGNQLSSQCWAAWITYLEQEQKAVTGPDGKPLSLPGVHLITDAERAIDLVNSLQSTSPMTVACAPLANQVKLNVLSLITTAATGALIGGIPLP